MVRVACVLPLVVRLDSDRRRAERRCFDERHKLLGINCLAGVFTLLICFCILVVKYDCQRPICFSETWI